MPDHDYLVSLLRFTSCVQRSAPASRRRGAPKGTPSRRSHGGRVTTARTGTAKHPNQLRRATAVVTDGNDIAQRGLPSTSSSPLRATAQRGPKGLEDIDQTIRSGAATEDDDASWSRMGWRLWDVGHPVRDPDGKRYGLWKKTGPCCRGQDGLGSLAVSRKDFIGVQV